MSKLDEDQILAASIIVEEAFKEDTIGILYRLNNTGKLKDFLKMTGLNSAVQKELDSNLTKTRKILVVGAGMAKEIEYRQQCRNARISPEGFEFFLDYHDAKKMDFEKYKNNPEYGGIIVGPMDHSGPAKKDYPSIIDRLENEAGFPKVVRGNEGGELKLSLNSFYNALLTLYTSGAITI